MTTLILLALSYWGGLGDWAGSLLPVRVDAAEIDPATLLTRPQAEDGIQLFEERTTQNPEDAVSLAILGQLYAQQAWETDDVPLYRKAAETQQQSLSLLPDYEPARVALAAAHLAVHQFEEAYSLGLSIYEENPKRVDALATAGDAALALGRYQEAERIYGQLKDEAPSSLVQVRLAHLAELNGDREGAIHIMQRATKEALSAGQDKDQLAWYLFRLGDLYFDIGRFDDAAEYLQAALRVRPDYPAALGVLAEIEAANGRLEAAIALYQQELELGSSIGTLAALGDLFILTGQTTEAQTYYLAIETEFAPLAETDPAIYGRELAAFYADHDIQMDKALELITADLDHRQDIQGYDTAAWIYYRLGELDKAQEMMSLARQLGTLDAALLYHAGMIAQARGETAEAANLLSQALDINPAFDPIQARIAGQTLNSTKGS
jgi:tetratricopeptide (TPR) repeat protein